MRHHIFIALLAAAIVLDLAFLGLGLAQPGARLFQAPAALAAPQQVTAAPPRPTPSPTASPTATPSPTPSPTASPTATPSPTVTPSPTATPSPTPLPEPRLLAGKSVSFTPSDRAVRANIRLALGHYAGALAHVVLAPGEIFSFNAALGQHPQGLPWKNVRVKPTASPSGEAAQDQLIQGGGLCDLASRYVMAARPLLPARAFRFVNHVRSNGIHLAGVPARDSVSIWAVGGGKGEQDLTIANTTAGWVEWIVEREGEKITVTARLWDQPPPG